MREALTLISDQYQSNTPNDLWKFFNAERPFDPDAAQRRRLPESLAENPRKTPSDRIAEADSGRRGARFAAVAANIKHIEAL